MSVTRCLSMPQRRVSFHGLSQQGGSTAEKTMRPVKGHCGTGIERNDHVPSLGADPRALRPSRSERDSQSETNRHVGCVARLQLSAVVHDFQRQLEC